MSKNAEYAEQYADLAMEQMRRYGIPASVTLAQGILESSNGRSGLALNENNHFGIKATPQWIEQGGSYALYDDDRPNERFCSYDSVRDSYEHHSRFLAEGDRYAGCFELSPDDYRGWTQGLADAGYATGGDYARKLQEIIERNGLQKYDRMVMAEMNGRELGTGRSAETDMENPQTEYGADSAVDARENKAQSPEDWMKRLLSSEDGGVDLSGTNDPVVDMMVKAFSSLMLFAAAIDGKGDDEREAEIAEMAAARKVDLTSLLPQMKTCSLSITGYGEAVLEADDGTSRISKELSAGELGRLSAILNNPDLSEEGRRMRVAGMVNSIILSEQASQNFEQGMEALQGRDEQIRR